MATAGTALWWIDLWGFGMHWAGGCVFVLEERLCCAAEQQCPTSGVEDAVALIARTLQVPVSNKMSNSLSVL